MGGMYYNERCINRMEGAKWIHLAQDKDQWQVYLHTAMSQISQEYGTY
jgi:hypothetical protein